MLRKLISKARGWQTRFSFGSTSAIITNLALMAGLHSQPNARVSIIGGILVIALADNISDSFGIHIYQESEKIATREIWASTFINFLSRIIVSLSFIALILLLPLNNAICASILWGLLLLALVSYMVAKEENSNPASSILTHLLIAIAVIFASNLVGDFLNRHFAT